MMARVAALVSPRVTLEAVDIASQLHETILKKTKDKKQFVEKKITGTFILLTAALLLNM
jgi:hypothetical protein